MKSNKQDVVGRAIGLGQSPTDSIAAGVFACGFTQVPVIESVTWTVNLPVADVNLTTFGDEIDVLQNPKQVQGVTSVDSSFVINGILQVDMLAIGFGVHAFGEPQQGSVIGNYVNPAPLVNQVPNSPDSFTLNDVLNGAIGPDFAGETPQRTINPAILEWGGPVQNALWHLLNAYRFKWIMQQRYELINEIASDVSYFASYAEAEAAGTSQEAAQRLIRRANDTYQKQGATGAFVPVNSQRIGSVGPSALHPATNIGVFHPSRATDELDVTWGGLRGQDNQYSTPFRRLIRPVLLEKGIPIGMLLEVQDQYHQTEMLRYLSQTDNGSGAFANTVANVAFAAGSGGTTETGVDTFLELTFDTPNQLVAQQVPTDRILMKGGAMQLGILIKGFEVWGPWKQYIQSQLVQRGLVSLPGQTSGYGGLAA